MPTHSRQTGRRYDVDLSTKKQPNNNLKDSQNSLSSFSSIYYWVLFQNVRRISGIRVYAIFSFSSSFIKLRAWLLPCMNRIYPNT